MKKKIFSGLLVFILLLLPIVCASSESSFLIDSAGVLSESEAQELEEQLAAASRQLNFDIAVATTKTLNGTDIESSARSAYEQYGFGTDGSSGGALLLLDMENAAWCITTGGVGETLLDNRTRGSIADTLSNDLRQSDFYSAFEAYSSSVADAVSPSQRGGNSTGRGSFRFVPRFLICLALGFLIALICMSVMKSRLKSVRQQSAAADYIQKDSMKLTASRERFLYRTVTRTEKAQPRQTPGGSAPHPPAGGSSTGGRPPMNNRPMGR